MQTIEDFGFEAAFCDLQAAKETDPKMKAWWSDLSDVYRTAQYNTLFTLRKCSTDGCSTQVAGSEFCPRCEDEINGTPYPLANVLYDAEPWAKSLVFTAFAIVCAAMAWMTYMIVR